MPILKNTYSERGHKMNDVTLFSSNEFGDVRVVSISGEPWFVAKDVAVALGYADTSDAVKRHVDPEDKLTRCFTDSGQTREMIIINESGLYSLTFSSRLESAKRFKHWVTSEVLPSIRKNGGYVLEQESMSDEDLMARAYVVAQRVLADREKRLSEANNVIAIQNQQISEMQPKVTYYDIVLSCKNAIPITIIAKDYGWTAPAMNQKLHDLGVQYHVNKTWVLYKEYAGLGYTKSVTYPVPGTIYCNVVTQWTQKGRLFIYELLKNHGYLPICERDNIATA